METALVHGYSRGIVCGHDGSVYEYEPADIRISASECESIHNAIAYHIQTGAVLDDVWFDMLKYYGMEARRR